MRLPNFFPAEACFGHSFENAFWKHPKFPRNLRQIVIFRTPKKGSFEAKITVGDANASLFLGKRLSMNPSWLILCFRGPAKNGYPSNWPNPGSNGHHEFIPSSEVVLHGGLQFHKSKLTGPFHTRFYEWYLAIRVHHQKGVESRKMYLNYGPFWKRRRKCVSKNKKRRKTGVLHKFIRIGFQCYPRASQNIHPGLQHAKFWCLNIMRH